jgi:hypothetical protein
MFWRNISPPSSGSKSKPSKKPAEAGSKLSVIVTTMRTSYPTKELYVKAI